MAGLGRLFLQELPEGTELAVVLLDDNSSDDTADAVRAQFPQVRLLRGNGDLLWRGGMRYAFAEVLREDFDFYLLLNDDTRLEPDEVTRLLSTYHSVSTGHGIMAIIVASTCDPQTGMLTYGGVLRSSRIHPITYLPVQRGQCPWPCYTMNGNCVLIPRAVAVVAENLSAEFRPGIVDFDYGLRARQPAARCGCRQDSPAPVHRMARQADSRTWASPMRRRWQHMMSHNGLPPDEYLVYVRWHGGHF
ncbi:MAG: glycosyltransferase [Acidobacteriia bacterium]|nr:glycosyltransferase [Terriglobia bacterium]